MFIPSNGKNLPQPEFGLLSFVPLLDGTKIPYHPGKDFAGRRTGRACLVFAAQIAVGRAYAEGRCQREIWEPVVFAYPADEMIDGLSVRYPFTDDP
jgi:hypothetical protein